MSNIVPRLLLTEDEGCVMALTGDYAQNAKPIGGFYTLKRLASAVRRGQFPRIEHKVLTMCGSSVRGFANVKCTIDGKQITALVDLVTGSLYDKKTGQCYSGNLRIV